MSCWPGLLSWAQNFPSVECYGPVCAVIGKVTKKIILLNYMLVFFFFKVSSDYLFLISLEAGEGAFRPKQLLKIYRELWYLIHFNIFKKTSKINRREYSPLLLIPVIFTYRWFMILALKCVYLGQYHNTNFFSFKFHCCPLPILKS